LEFGIYLEFGAWNLEFYFRREGLKPSPTFGRHPQTHPLPPSLLKIEGETSDPSFLPFSSGREGAGG